VEICVFDGEGCHFRVADAEVFFVGARIKFGVDAQVCFGRAGADQFNDRLVTAQGFAASVFCYLTEHPVFDFIPFARAWREVAYRHAQAALVGPLLEAFFPQPSARTVGASAVGHNQDLARLGVTPFAHLRPPASDDLSSNNL
jgi:hypothetical protein